MFSSIFVAIEKVLGIVYDFTPRLFKIMAGVPNHRLILLSRRTEDLGHLKLPAFAEDGNYRSAGINQKLDLRIILDSQIGSTSGPKRRDLSMIPSFLRSRLEKLNILRVRPGPATFNIVHPEFIQPLSDSNLVQARQ